MQSETQATIHAWSESVFPAVNGSEAGIRSQALKLLHEAVELAAACGATNAEIHASCFVADADPEKPRQWYDRDYDPAAVPGELADVIIVAFVLAARSGIDAMAEVDKKMQTNRHERTWITNPDGSAQHSEV